MGTLSSVVSALSTFYQDSNDPHDPDQVHLSILRLMAKLPTIAAYAYKKSIGQPFLYPDNSLDLIENFLTMMFAVPSERYEVSHNTVVTLKQLLILHADHEQNCSTSTVRLVGSSEANLFASIAAGINALWGPLHGGANQAVIEMLDRIARRRRRRRQVRPHGQGPRRLVPALGLRSPRATRTTTRGPASSRTRCHRVISELGSAWTSSSTSRCGSRRSRSSDEYFVERKLYPNVDFYSGLIYRAMGFPTQMFPVLFAMGRLPGWIAHWVEMMESPTTKIGRPRQIYTGATKRPYVPIETRRRRVNRLRVCEL